MSDDLIPSSDLPPYTLPLNREEYTQALRLGLGRALLHAREFGISEFIEETADSCMRCYEHDAQLNGNRTEWMLDIIDAADTGNLVADRIADTWAPPSAENRRYADENQLAEILSHFAKNGHPISRDVLHRVFRIDAHTSLLVGGFEIIELDGMDGLKTVCRKILSWLDAEPDIYFVYAPIRYYDEIHGDGAAMETLTKMSCSDPCIAEYLDYLENCEQPEDDGEDTSSEHAVDEYDKRREATRSALRSTPAEAVIDAIRNDSPNWPSARLWHWGKEATEENLQKIVDALLDESDPGNLAKYLRVFRYRSLPMVCDRLINLAQHEIADVRKWFFMALCNTRHSSIRNLALQSLSDGNIIEGQLELLKLNSGPGDGERIERSLSIPDDDWDLHTITTDLSILCEQNPTEEYAGLMLFVYENTNCGYCRSRVLKSLLKADAAPGWLLEEAPFCSSEDVRDALNPGAGEDF